MSVVGVSVLNSNVENHVVVCAYCGKEFIRTYHNRVYCCDDCRGMARREKKAEYQRRRRKLIREGELVSMESEYIGTGFLSKHRRDSDEDELKAILKEKKRLGL